MRPTEKFHDKLLEKNNKIRFACRIAFGGSRMFKYILPMSCSFSIGKLSQGIFHAISLMRPRTYLIYFLVNLFFFVSSCIDIKTRLTSS